MRCLRWVVYFVVLQILPVWAWPPTFGTELNFTNNDLIRNFNTRIGKHGNTTLGQTPDKGEHAWVMKLADTIFENCKPECERTSHAGKFNFEEYRFTFPGGRSFNISVDPLVVEVQVDPATATQIRERVEFLDKNLFEPAKKMGLNLRPGDNAHLNIGILSAFKGDAAGFLRLFTDHANMPELSSGILGSDFANAPPLHHLKVEQQQALVDIVAEFNSGKHGQVEDLAYQIQKRVYTDTPVFDDGAQHYQAVGMKYVNQNGLRGADQPFEFRAVRNPRNAEEYALVTEFFEKWMSHVKNNKRPISYQIGKKKDFSNSDLVSRFAIMSEEIGMPWDQAKMILTNDVRKTDVDNFVKGAIDLRKKHDVALFRRYFDELHTSGGIESRVLDVLRRDDPGTENLRKEIVAEFITKYQGEAHMEGARRSFVEKLGSLSPTYSEMLAAAKIPYKRLPAAVVPGVSPNIRDRCQTFFARFAHP